MSSEGFCFQVAVWFSFARRCRVVLFHCQCDPIEVVCRMFVSCTVVVVAVNRQLTTTHSRNQPTKQLESFLPRVVAEVRNVADNQVTIREGQLEEAAEDLRMRLPLLSSSMELSP